MEVWIDSTKDCDFDILIANQNFHTNHVLTNECYQEGNSHYNDSIGQLEILFRRGYFSLPTYKYKETHDEDGNPIWACQCRIKEVDNVTNGRSSSKKDSKKQAAYDMLTYVLEEE